MSTNAEELLSFQVSQIRGMLGFFTILKAKKIPKHEMRTLEAQIFLLVKDFLLYSAIFGTCQYNGRSEIS